MQAYACFDISLYFNQMIQYRGLFKYVKTQLLHPLFFYTPLSGCAS